MTEKDIKPLIQNLNDPIMLRSVEKILRGTGMLNKSDHDKHNVQEENQKMLKFYKTPDNRILINDPTGNTELIPNTVEAAFEMHIPIIEHNSDSVTVTVGSVRHPMLEAHYIILIVLETATGYQRKELKPGDEPIATFAVTEPVEAAYEYCNLHGLWKAEA